MNIPTILLIEDEDEQRKILRDYLEPRIKCKIAEVSTAGEAIDFIKNNPCDLMIVDIKIPGGSGIDVLEAAKGMPIVSIAYTNWDSEQVYKECIERGAKAYLSKVESIKIIGDKIIKELKERKQYFPA